MNNNNYKRYLFTFLLPYTIHPKITYAYSLHSIHSTEVTEIINMANSGMLEEDAFLLEHQVNVPMAVSVKEVSLFLVYVHR